MSIKARKKSKYSEKDTVNIRRFIYDLMMYTLPKCGFPDTKLPSSDDQENVYIHANLLKIAGVCTLRIALIIRDKCRVMFQSRRKSSGFNDENIPPFMVKVVKCYLHGLRKTKQVMVEIFLALCHEIILFLYSEDIFFDFNSLIATTVCLIMRFGGLKSNSLKRLEELFEKYEELWKESIWVPHFIAKFAIPYGSREDVSNLFSEHSELYQSDRSKILDDSRGQRKALYFRLGFLPHEICTTIQIEGFVYLSESLELASESILPGDRESPEPPALPTSSEN
ncbi:unnamed protein product [Larinioides sclopetarius]|uniref:Uncharacterized protein n=1 Tax=Larinioides sclopetarius TaxID=280406 RepID=A0AAV2A556_9ARAC